jgi:hypothetical protein
MNRCDGFLLELMTAPITEPVTIGEMIEQVREFTSLAQASEDRLTALIVVARQWVERYTGRALVDQKWRLNIGDANAIFRNVDSDTVSGYYRGPYEALRDGRILLRRSPVIEITRIATVDSAGDETVVDSTTYELREADSKWPSVLALTGSLAGPLRIEFRAGYIDTSASPFVGEVPEIFLQALRLQAEAHYNRDEKMMALLVKAAENLLDGESANHGFA